MMQGLRRWMRAAGGARERGIEAPELRVLMVCMGNICRSPTAEGVLAAMVQRSALNGRVLVDSAGTLGLHAGEAPDARSIRHAALRGYDLARLRARQVVTEDFERFQVLLAMDEDNRAWLQRRTPPGAKARVALLMDFARSNTGQRTVPDPYYGGPAGFEQVLDLVEDACAGLVDQWTAQLERGEALA